jgi:transposase-like protein
MEKTRRHFTPQQKVAILREHLVEHVPVSDLCDKHKLHPTVFYQWQKAFFENGTTAFESRRPRSQSLFEEEDKIAALETKLRNKTEVLAEVVEELVRTKKELWGELSGRWIAHDTGDNVIDFIKRLSARTEISPLRLVGWMELSRSEYYEWRDRYGKANDKRPSLPLATKKSSRPEKPVKPNATKTTPAH